MNYYTDTISITLAEKLKEKGMPIEKEGENTWCPSYAEVFDWLMNRGQRVYIVKSKSGADIWHGLVNDSLNTLYYDTWHEAAEKAIEKALDLIKQ